jgi:hypothetical protein
MPYGGMRSSRANRGKLQQGDEKMEPTFGLRTGFIETSSFFGSLVLIVLLVLAIHFLEKFTCGKKNNG